MVRLTPVVKNLLIINGAIYLIQLIMSGLPIIEYMALYNVRTELFKPYQLFTYMFAHHEFFHIFFNMMALSFFGPILESTWGSMRFLTFYIVCGIGAALFYIGVDLYLGAASFGSMIGASGAIYGLLTAFGILYPNMEIMLLFPPIPIKAKYLVLGFAGLALYSALNPKAGDNTAHFAHLGGIVVALILLQFWKGIR
jgi:membrane associated rhomboid family serine protease